jgi:hypothetical protein
MLVVSENDTNCYIKHGPGERARKISPEKWTFETQDEEFFELGLNLVDT